MEELEQKDLMIQQLKDIVRANEQILQQKEKELQETTAKFQKLKLQSKAKITQLTHQVKAHASSPGTDAGGEAGSGPSSPAQSEAADRGRLRMLKHQLDEAKQRLEKSERDAQARHRVLEATVEQLQAQLLQRDQALAEARPATSKAELPHEEDREKLYAQMVYKDSRILELSREAEALEARILDLQESLREKDQVLQARTRAVQLVTEDLSLRSKTAVDDLDDTRAEMQRLQRDFLEREAAWKEREASLAADLAAGQARVKECEEAVGRVESTRFELAARNAELQERLVKAQEAATRGRAEHDKVVQEKLDSLNKELEAKSAALEEAQGTLRETDARILKARALERRRAKVLERELAELRKGLPDGEAMTALQQRIAELEEEKGALQLRALETEDTLSAQASKLEEMAQKEAAIAELERQLKEAQEEKISLEMRAAELEEQKETEERKMQSLQQELEVLKTGSAPLLEQELKTALEEEVRRLVSQHEEDVRHAAQLGEALAQAEAEAKSATARADELAETLQCTLGELEVERTEARKLKGTHAAEVRTKSEEVERLNAALHDMSQSLNESLRAADEHSREAHDQIEANMAKIEELDTTHRDSLNELKWKSEQLEELKLALDDAQQALEGKTRDADMLSDALTGLKASLAEAENKHATLEATLSAKEREIQSILESVGVSTLGEVNAAWEELRRASSLEIEEYYDRMAELDTRNKELTGKVESLDNALEESETIKSRLAKVDACLESLAVSSLEELTHKWNTLNDDLATITRTQKLNNEDIDSQIKLLTDERSGLRMEIAAKESKIAELASEVVSMKTLLEERELALAQEKAAHAEARGDIGRLKKALSTSKKKTEVKFKTLLDQSSDLEKEVSVLQSQLEEKCQLLESVQHALDSKCTQMEETTRDFASRKAAAEAQISELIQQLQDKEQDVSTLQEQLNTAVQKADSEITSLQQSLGASAQTSSRLQTELMDLRSSLETMTAEKDSVDKQLKEVENGLQKAQDERKQLELSLSTITADLESSQAAVAKLEDACTFMKEQLGVAEAEKAELSEQLTNSLRYTQDVKQEKEVLEARSDMLSNTIKELECKLCEAQHMGQQKEKEMIDELSRLQVEKVDACKELEKTNQEKRELSLKLSEMEDKLDGLTKQNEDWKQKEEFVLGQLEELQKQYDNSNAESKRQLEEMAETCRSVTEEHNLCKVLLDRTTEELKETQIILAENQKESEATAQACASFKELSDQLAKEVSSLRLEQTKKQEELERANAEKDSLSEAVASLKELVATKASQLDSLQVVLASKDAELKSLRDSAELQQSDIAIKLSEMSKELELRTGELSLMNAALEERDAFVASLKEGAAAWSTKLQESEEINRNLNAQVESLAERVTEASKAIKVKEANLQKATEDLKTLMDSNEKLSRDLQVLQESCKELNDVKQDLELKVNVANSKVANLETTLTEQDHMVDKLRSELEATKAELVATSSKLEDTAGKAEEHEQKLKAAIESGSALVEEATRLRQEKESMASTLEKLRSQSDANMKLESEVANYMAKVADNERSIQDLETKLECLHQENASIRNQLALASADAEVSAQGHDKQVKELKEQLQNLNGEVDRLQRFEDLYREAEVQLAEARGYHEAAEARLDALKHAADIEKRHETAAVMEEVLVQSAAKLQGASKDSQKKGEGDVQMSQSEGLSKELESKQAEVEKLKSLLSSQEEDTKKLLEELETVKRSLETAEMQLKSSPQDTQKLQGSTKSPQSETTHETGDELKKLKVAFKKSRGELRLKLRILEDKTKELDAVKAQNNSLQTDLQQMVEALSSEKLATKELLHKMQDRDDQLALASEEVAKLREECAAAKTDLALSLERISEEKALQEGLLGRLKSAEMALSFSQTQVEELQSKKAVPSIEDIELLKSKLAQAETELERLSEENKSLLASRSEEGQGLLSELALAKAEMQQMSLEHERNIEASFGREQALQSECEAASALLGEMQAQQAEFSQAKSQEFEALQAQLVSLSGDLAKQLELVDAKVEEADTLKEKFEASQLELERFSAEYRILQDVLLQECGEDLTVVKNDSERREFSAFEYLKKLLDNAKCKREALENQLAEKEEQFNLLQQNYQSLEDRYQRPLQDLGAFVRSIIEHTNQSSEAAVSLEASQLEDLNWLLAVLQEQVTSLKVRNELLTQESQQWKSSCEDASEKMKCLSDESRHWQQRYKEVAETLKEKENVVKCHNSSQTEAGESFITEKEQVEVHAEKKELLNQVSQLKEEMAMLKTESFGSNDSSKDLQKELSATKLKFEKMMMKLKLFREKNSRLEEQLSSLQKVNGDLEQIYQQKKNEASHLEEKCRALQEEVETLSRNDHTETVVQHLQQTFERAEKAEAECARLDERVGSLLERNGKLEIEADFLRSELSSLKEQAEMLVSDNENFQQLAENLKQARHCLEEELKTQHEQHVKATKELENEHRRALDEAAKCEAALSALKTDYSQLQEKYNQIVYRHRDLQEEFHVAAQEKRHLEDRCAQLTEEWATARRALTVFEEQQGAVGQKTLQELQELRQANQQLQERFHLFKDKHLKAEERLVQAPNQEVGASMERVTEGTGGTARTSEAPTNRVEIEELSRRYESLVEHSRAKESKWNQEKKQLKHIEEHLKEAAETLSAELQVLKTKHEEALEAKLELRGQLEQMTKDNRALSQQVQNWRSYIKGFEENKEGGKGLEAPEVDRLRLELDQTMRNLHQLGLRNEEMSVDLSKVLEERSGLRHQLSHAQEALRQREDQLVRLQSRLPASRDSHFVVVEDDSQQADLHQRLAESERLRVELQETVEELRSSLRRERQRRTLIEDEWDLLEEGRRIEALPSDTQTLLLHEDIIKIPPTEYSITRQFRSHAHKLRQWLLGRQRRCLGRRWRCGQLALGLYLLLVHVCLLSFLL
ncbi:hypothetical protein HPB47_016459 [Ixodes persulcatus]|uniref:Uncharacterized protein n=1 Tax=Ixodes persulcatus TaxID=34615 RepID=A0AC60QSW8_IXOPE|nr:hypothetical protein HPB47_016459 [Ixodes persulcatus]